MTVFDTTTEERWIVGECRSGTALSSLRDEATLRCLHPSGFNRISQGELAC